MKKKSDSFCSFTALLSLFLIVYIFTNLFLSHENNVDENGYVIKIISFAALFIVLSLVFAYLKLYKKSYVESQVQERTQALISENETLKIHSHIDTLTQVLNKKYFMDRFNEEFKRAIREKQSLSLIIVDIDEFKAFNDIYGENEGNECLKLVANILINHCNRPSDLVSRFEGDEFYMLLPNTKEPKVIAKRCIDSVRSLNIPHENSIASNVLTISMGIATLLPVHNDQKKELIQRAQDSLKNAKKTGRNRFC